MHEQKQINEKLQHSSARTQRDFMAPTFTELMRQSAQKNKDGANRGGLKSSLKPRSNGSSSNSSSGLTSKTATRKGIVSSTTPHSSNGAASNSLEMSNNTVDLSLSGMSNKNGSSYKKKGGSGSNVHHASHNTPLTGATSIDPFADPGDTSNNSEGMGTDIKDSDDGAGLHVFESGRKGRNYSYFDDGHGNIQVDLRLG